MLADYVSSTVDLAEQQKVVCADSSCQWHSPWSFRTLQCCTVHDNFTGWSYVILTPDNATVVINDEIMVRACSDSWQHASCLIMPHHFWVYIVWLHLPWSLVSMMILCWHYRIGRWVWEDSPKHLRKWWESSNLCEHYSAIQFSKWDQVQPDCEDTSWNCRLVVAVRVR